MRTTLSLACWAGAAIAIGLLGSLAPASGIPGPELEGAWETGKLTEVHDGDTVQVSVGEASKDGNRGSQRVRTIGVQAPEVAHGSQAEQCGAAAATKRLQRLVPKGSKVQLRSLRDTSYDDYSDGRIVRSIYALDEEGNWYDTSRSSVSDGVLLWFPLAATSAKKPEWAHNLEYRVLAEDAMADRRGLWARDACGPWAAPGAQLRVWVAYHQSAGSPERIFIANEALAPIDLAGWTVRDSALNRASMPPGTTLAPDEVLEVQLNEPGQRVSGFPGVASVVHTDTGSWFTNLPADNSLFIGDVAYLLDSAGPFETGNLRSWFPYPCNPDACADPLEGRVKITAVQASEPTRTAPSEPRAVGAVAGSDGSAGPASGRVEVSWEAPNTVGGAEVTDYQVVADPVGDAPPLPAMSVGPVRRALFPGLVLGQGYTFTVSAVNAVGASPPSLPSAHVTPVGPPPAPAEVKAAGRRTSAVVSWAPPATSGGQPITRYVARATPGDRTCTTQGATSCVVSGLTSGVTYTFSVSASNATGEGPRSAATPGVQATPEPAAPGAPTKLVAEARDGTVVVSWWWPDDDGGAPITGFTASVDAGSVVSRQSCRSDEAAGPVASCLITGLANGTAYSVGVTATNRIGTGPAATLPGKVTPASYQPVDPSARPDAPTDLRAVAGDASATISWRAPASDGGAQIQRYTVTADPGGRTCLTQGDAAGVTSCRVAGLANGRSHTFVVVAQNAVGSSETSAQSAPVTPVQVAPPALPAAPTSVLARAGDGRAVVSWASPSDGGSQILSYEATAISTSGGSSRTCRSQDAATSCVVSGLANGSDVSFRVSAANAIGWGPASLASLLVTPRPDILPVTSAAGVGGGFVPDPWVSGEYVDLANVGDSPARLGGYGLWTRNSTSTEYDEPT